MDPVVKLLISINSLINHLKFSVTNKLRENFRVQTANQLQ